MKELVSFKIKDEFNNDLEVINPYYTLGDHKRLIFIGSFKPNKFGDSFTQTVLIRLIKQHQRIKAVESHHIIIK